MIKINKVENNVSIDDNTINQYKLFSKNTYFVAESKIKEKEIERKSTYERKQSILRDLNYVKLNLATINKDKNELSRIYESMDSTEHLAQFKKDCDTIKKLSDIVSIHIDRGTLSFTTKPLYTMIRVSDGSKTEKRKCIGAFSVIIRGVDVEVRQLLFNGIERPHWSVNMGSYMACLGDWTDTIVSLYQAGDVVGLVKNMTQYLQSTLDGGAYMKSHDWIAERDSELLRYTATHIFSIGDCVLSRYGAVGIVTALHANGVHMTLHEKDAIEASTQWYDSEEFVKITKVKYRMQEIDKDKLFLDGKKKLRDTRNKRLEELDESKNKTLDELRELIKTV